ncbi:hypothetical protein C8R44DRAFT_746129 [Mycena epipterygia]|nr:hypothetical protein C8R44DRAFT_746129 [Mycena epipterygia]
MADEPHYPAEAPPLGILGQFGSSGAFISNSRSFTITDSHFTNVIYGSPTIASGEWSMFNPRFLDSNQADFRTIPLGDLDLRKEIRLDDSGVASRHHGVRAARRIYTARIEGKQSGMTAAIYEGEHAEENWNYELSKYSGFRHPNFVQLYGTVNSGGLYATIFHDNLVPVKQFFEEHRNSVMTTVYLYIYFDANEYFQEACCHLPLLMHMLIIDSSLDMAVVHILGTAFYWSTFS